MEDVLDFFKKPMNVILIGTAISIIGALCGGAVTALGTYIQNKSSSERNTRIESGVNESVEIGKNTNSSVSVLKDQNVELKNQINIQAKIIEDLRSSNTKLADQNSQLLHSNTDISNSNKILNTQSQDMLQKIGKYQDDIEERNRRIEELNKELDKIKAYTFYATRNHLGLDRMYSSDFEGFDTDLSKKMAKVFYSKGNQWGVNRDVSLLPSINDVISQYPTYPFAYWAKAFLESYSQNVNAKNTAKQCIEILEITTKIEGHHEDHDVVLKILKNDMRKNK